MRVLLDECVDRRLARDLVGHRVAHVARLGWTGTKNGALLRRAEGEFDAFVTVDRNLRFQQPISQFEIAVFVLRAASNRWNDLRLLAPDLLQALRRAVPRTVVWLGPVAASKP